MFTPGALPFNKRAISISGFCSRSFLPIEETAYPNAFFSFLIPNAVTTTSLKSSFKDFKVKLVTAWEVASFFSKPTLETCKTAPVFTLILYAPFASDSVLFFEALFSVITAPSTGVPFSSVTLPVTVVF